MLGHFFELVFLTTVNVVFACVMLGLFLLACFFIPKGQGRLYQIAVATPTLLTSIGILGTFVGIVIALIGFDDSNVKSHINQIIAGMQTAFVSSVIGVFLSILLKFILLLANRKQSQDIVTYTIELLETQNEKLEQHASFVKEQTDAIREMLKHSKGQQSVVKAQSIAIERLVNAIGSDSENSLIGQITRLRSDINDNHKNLTQELLPTYQKKQMEFFTNLATKIVEYHSKKAQKFQIGLFDQLDKVSEIISKSATEQVINALKEVITDFNNNLTEQFGENFKALNRAVFKLVEWQDKYAWQIQQMIEQYEQAVLAIDNTKQAVLAIESSTQAIPKTMDSLSDILAVNQQQINELNRHLNAFADLQEKATQALPTTQSHISLMLQGIQEGSERVISGMGEIHQSMLQKLSDYNKKIQDDLKESQNEIKDAHDTTLGTIKQFNGEFKVSSDNLNTMMRSHIESSQEIFDNLKLQLDKITTELESHVKENNEEQLKQMKKLLGGLEVQAQGALNDTGESIEKQIKALQNAQKQELEQVMTEMGRALATITKRFTNDYKELVDQMDKVIRMHSTNRNGF